MSGESKSGWLELQVDETWKRIHAVVDGVRLIYYANELSQPPFGSEMLGEVSLSKEHSPVVTVAASDERVFTISTHGVQKKFRAPSGSDAKYWVEFLSDPISMFALSAAASSMRDSGYRFEISVIDGSHLLVSIFRPRGLEGNQIVLAISVQGGVLIVISKGIPNASPEVRGELLEAVVRANYGLRVGGFNMDYRDGEIRFQTEVPLLGVNSPDVFKAVIKPLIGINLSTHERYFMGFVAIKEGRKSAAQAIADIEGSEVAPTGATPSNAAQIIVRQIFDGLNFSYQESPNLIIAKKPHLTSDFVVKVHFGPVIMVLSSFFSTTPEDARSETIEAITRSNYGMRIGQFIMDHRDGEILYQSELPLAKGTYTTEDLTQLIAPIIAANIQTHQRYLVAFDAIRNHSKSALVAIAEVEGTALPDRLQSLNLGATKPSGPSSSANATNVAANGEGDHDYRDILLDRASFSRVVGRIGQGVTGPVYQAIYASNPVIVKEVSLEKHLLDSFLDEVRLQVRIHHANIVGVLGVVRGCVQERAASGTLYIVEDHTKLLLVMQCCNNGSLAHWLRGVREGSIEFSEYLAVRLMEETAMGMAMLHARDIVHMDLKPSNILLSSDQRACVGDFGLLSHFMPGSLKEVSKLIALHEAGNLVYIDPVSLENGITSRSSDVYAFGILLHNVFVTRSLESPYSHDADLRLAQNMGNSAKYVEVFREKMKSKLRPSEGSLDHLSPPVKAALQSLLPFCLEANPTNRPRFEDIAVILNRTREYLDSIGSNIIPQAAFAPPITSSSVSLRGPLAEPPSGTTTTLPPAPPATFQLLPTVEAIKKGLGIESSVKLDEALREAGQILGIEDEIGALKTAKEKALRIKEEMGI